MTILDAPRLSTPDTEAALIEAVQAAGRSGKPVRVAGHDTKLGLGRPVEAEAVISTAKLTGVTLYEPAELVLSARAGTPVSEIEALLAGNDQMLAFEPPDYAALLGTAPGQQSIGGVVACNLSGPRRVHTGAARDLLIGTRAVNGRGEAILGGGRVMKNVTGLDLPRVLAGSYGTLAILSEVTFKVLPRGEVTATLVVSDIKADGAAAVMASALTSPYEVSGAAWLPGSLAGSVGLSDIGVGAVLLRLENFAPFVTRRIAALRERLAVLPEIGGFAECDTDTSRALWRKVADVMPLAGEDSADRLVWRLSVPAVLGSAVFGAVSQALAAEGIAVDGFMDWGGGLIWLATGGEAGTVRALLDRVVAHVVTSRGGRVTLVRADTISRIAVPVFDPMGETLLALSQRLKASFDPDGLLNPGRMQPGL